MMHTASLSATCTNMSKTELKAHLFCCCYWLVDISWSYPQHSDVWHINHIRLTVEQSRASDEKLTFLLGSTPLSQDISSVDTTRVAYSWHSSGSSWSVMDSSWSNGQTLMLRCFHGENQDRNALLGLASFQPGASYDLQSLWKIIVGLSKVFSIFH